MYSKRIGFKKALPAFEANLVANSLADLLTTLGCDSFGNADRRQASWLSTENTTRPTTGIAFIKYHLRNLRENS